MTCRLCQWMSRKRLFSIREQSIKSIVYTSDQRKITKLDKFCREANPEWKEVSADKINGKIVSKTYETSEKNILYLKRHIAPSISE